MLVVVEGHWGGGMERICLTLSLELVIWLISAALSGSTRICPEL